MSKTLRCDRSLDVFEKREYEFFDGNALFVLWDIWHNTRFVLGDESSVSDLGFKRAVGTEVDGFTLMIDSGVFLFADFYFAILWRLVFEFGHNLVLFSVDKPL